MSKATSLVVSAPVSSPWASCLDRFETTVATYPDTLALIACHQSADRYGYKSEPLDSDQYRQSPYLRWTYSTLRSAVEQLARSLTSRGIKAGTPVFTFLPNGAEFSTIYWATDLLGCTIIPINIRNLSNEREVAHMIETAFKGCPDAITSVVIAADPETAAKLDGFEKFSESLKFVSGSDDWQHWAALSQLVARPSETLTFTKRSSNLPPKYWGNLILFTSGTTNLPKGVRWEDPNLSFLFATRDVAGPGYNTEHGHIVANLAPNNHAIGCFIQVQVLVGGGTVLYPAAFFEPTQFLAACRAERCTTIVAVPTMIYALLLAKTDESIKLEYLKTVILGGASVTPEVLRLCVEELGATGVENGYGMTERIYSFSGSKNPKELSRGSDVAIGRPYPGTSWKVCAPGTRKPLPRLEVGELHSSMPNMTSPYIGRETEEFYEEDNKPWFVTGDSAYVDEDDRIFIVGRFKEMIVRGGENISPAAIEAVVTQEAAFRPFQLQIVGALDEIAGEVPVGVVVKPIDAEVVKALKEFVTSQMGKMYSIDDVVSVQDLGITDYPRTMAGKVQKNKLAEIVRQYRQHDETTNGLGGASNYVNSKLADDILQIWARVAGVSLEDLKPATNLEQLGDSITLMRIKDRIYKRTGIKLTVKEILESRTLGNMISLAQSRAVGNVAPDNARFSPVDHPPTEEDMVHTVGDEDMFQVTKQVVSTAIRAHGLAWEDVRDVMPAYDFTEISAKNGTLERWSFKVALLFENVSVKLAQAAWKGAMANNPMQSSFIIWDEDNLGDDLTLQVTADQNDIFLNSLIEDRGSLKTVANLKKAAFDMVMFQGAQYPGPLHRVYFYYVEETKCAGAVWNMHHSVTDASFAQLFMEDLDLALTGAVLKPHVPYKLYCDNFYNLRTSPPARAATKFHVQKLKDLGKHIPHLFPPMDRPLQIEEGKADGIIRTWPANGVQNLINKHKHISASLVLKAATALCILNATSHTHAMFSQVEGARDRFPFMTNSAIEASKLEASDVGGQLFQSVLNMISLQPGEKTIAFLNRLQEDAVLQTKHASAPWKEIMRGIGGAGGEVFPILCTHCMFNWLGTDVSAGSSFQRLRLVDMPIRRDVAKFVNNAGWLRDQSGDKIQIHVRGSVWSISELDGFGAHIQAATEWMTDEENWDRSVSEFLKAMSDLVTKQAVDRQHAV